MSFDDPFNTAPSDAEIEHARGTTTKEETPVATPTVLKSEAVGDGEGKIVSTYKEGAGYDASWTVVHAASVDDWFAIHDDPRFKELLDKQKKVASYFRGGEAKSAAPAAGAAPQAAQEAPGGEKRFCAHGEMRYKSGVSNKTGKPYRMFACTSPDRNAQCKAEFLNN